MNYIDYDTRALANRTRRKKQLRRNIFVLTVSIFMAAVMSILFISFSTEANGPGHPSSYKYYKSIEVANGDTLWSIANANFDPEHYKNADEYINEVKWMNSLASDNITVGSHIIIPYFSSEFISGSVPFP